MFPNKYACLKKMKFRCGEYKIVPIRFEDRIDIMNWRNDQIYHLRQYEILTKPNQEKYFNDIVANLFDKETPNQILFSYLKNSKCIGYGGLVHINWKDKNAEISFIMDTKLEKEEFQFHWTTFLSLIEEVGFNELKMHKIYTYAFDLRPHLYIALEQANYFKDGVLKEHFCFNNKYLDVVIHSKINTYK